MKITIDTKEDSHEDIRKVIRMLQHLVGESSYTNRGNIFGDSSSSLTESSPGSSSGSGGNVFGNLFGGTPSTSETNEETKQTPDEDDEIPEIVPY
ncbi:hypothetical protein J4209_06900 [Candidatus Woesearchaeota archaeon]|nr:hypothetical protein [Candidatus Woesearchaeota archaeon]